MKAIPLVFAIICNVAIAKEDPNARYVGGGRYLCDGNAAKCAQIEANNRAQEERERSRYEDDQRRADDYIRENRYRDQYNRNRY